MLEEREFELINIIRDRIHCNQRKISQHLDLSLGMTNMLIRRLVSKGYIRIRQLNKKKVEYLLTPKGFAEKMRKSLKYTLKTIDSISLIKSKIKILISQLYEEGERAFYLVGKSDLVALVEAVIQEQNLTDCQYQRIQDLTEDLREGVVLICTEKFDHKFLNQKSVNLIQELAKDETFIQKVNVKQQDEDEKDVYLHR